MRPTVYSSDYVRGLNTLGRERRDNTLRKGDRIHATATSSGKMIAEMVMDGVGSISEIMSGLHGASGMKRGLVRIYIRNVSRGWSLERPCLFS